MQGPHPLPARPQDAPLDSRSPHAMTAPAPGGTGPLWAGSLLENLPDELLQLIVAHLTTADRRAAALVSRTFHRHATDLLWQTVCLADTRTLRAGAADELLSDGEQMDEHDDTPLIEKLHILATNPAIAAKVQTLTHRCHLPTPNIFTELPRLYFDAANLSADARLHALLRAAIRNLVNVHTLRIVYGHWRLTTALVAGFLHHARPREVPLRKLWLESCAFDIRDAGFLGLLSHTGLESIRLRRLRAETASVPSKYDMAWLDMKLARGGHYYQMHNGAGAWVGTTVEFAQKDLPVQLLAPTPDAMTATARAFDNLLWADLPEIDEFVDSLPVEVPWTPTLPRGPMQWLFEASQSTLTRLDLDWILWRQRELDDIHDGSAVFLKDLAAMRFPYLVAFQMRNAVLPLTKLPDEVFLLEDTFLSFLEAHPRIKCLAWPLDKFYNHTRPSVELQSRCRILIGHMAMVLTDLRLDTYYAGNGEPMTDESTSVESTCQRIRRRRFITEFAPHMRKIKQIKLEGGIPRDEKREILRALHYCPLQKIVFIGVSFPVGNTWGTGGALLKALDAGHASDFAWDLEEESPAGLFGAYRRRTAVAEPFTFVPEFGWTAEAPLLRTLALHHASTVQELKICGYNGCPVLSHLTPATTPLLAPLMQYTNLRHLVVSFWLLTFFEDAYRDLEIVQSWMDTRSPSSTALVVVTPPRSPDRDAQVEGTVMPAPVPTAPRPEFNRWAVALKTKFTPSALAYRVASDIAPFLSPTAKAREGGVRIRASFCLGAREERRVANDIFDLDIRVGADDQVLEFVGPREEGEKGRWWAKMEGRQWF
ncbi:hypothetical protein C7974DRAFT_230993 [Boeremia exigua]|uniref:uncharacterized protein n=1 Tax=Boeremia exigua TaxID=749465 RepID=UPI001E8DB18F|nr:uncharacterized protein C7974DRAFT_230993 [Boeremia exigua]KAH6620314.1 hypothetical protein C7974DRAFT_230993 [Boeremia exigua]